MEWVDGLQGGHQRGGNKGEASPAGNGKAGVAKLPLHRRITLRGNWAGRWVSGGKGGSRTGAPGRRERRQKTAAAAVVGRQAPSLPARLAGIALPGTPAYHSSTLQQGKHTQRRAGPTQGAPL
jgi:hypothetical protein